LSGVGHLPQLFLVLAQLHLRLLQIVDVRIRSVPPQQRVGLIANRHHADQEPPVLTVESSKARFGLLGLSRLEDAPPGVEQSRPIIVMNHRDPPPALAVLLGQAGIVHPLLVDELNSPVWRGAPDVGRDGVDHAKIVEFWRCHGACSRGEATTSHRLGQAGAGATKVPRHASLVLISIWDVSVRWTGQRLAIANSRARWASSSTPSSSMSRSMSVSLAGRVSQSAQSSAWTRE